MGRFTHKDVEAERRNPVGSLFMHLLDRDSVMPHPHCVFSARTRYNRSLEGLALSKYKLKETPEKSKYKLGELFANDGTPLRGRRRYSHKEISLFNETSKMNKTDLSRRKRRLISPMERDHLGQDLLPICNSPRLIRQRRFVASPTRKAESVASSALLCEKPSSTYHNLERSRNEIVCSNEENLNKCPSDSTLETKSNSLAIIKFNEKAKSEIHTNKNFCNGNRANINCNRRVSYCASDHLQLSSLIPSKCSPKRRSFSPPEFIIRPRHHGIKLFPPRRSLSVDDVKHGVKRVHPLPHWRAINDQQSDFLHIGVDFVAPGRKPYARSHSSNSVCNNSSRNTYDLEKSQQECLSNMPRWRGRSKSCTPPPRDFNIITNLPILH